MAHLPGLNTPADLRDRCTVLGNVTFGDNPSGAASMSGFGAAVESTSFRYPRLRLLIVKSKEGEWFASTAESFS